MARKKKETREEKFERARAYPVGENTESNGWWEPDCNGKGCFDGTHVRFNTRYWPDLTADCSVELMFKDPHEGGDLIEAWVDGEACLPYLQGKTVTLIETPGHLRAATFPDLRRKVERWHEHQRQRVEKALRAEFGK